MENKHIDKIKNIHIWCIEMLIGILTLSIVTVIAVDSDMSSTQKSLSYTAKYINERCNSFTRLNLASETKSLMRMIESAQQINRNIAYELEYNGGSDIYSEEFLKRNTQECYVTAVIFLDKEGKLSAQYYTDGLGAEYLDEHLDSSSLINVSENVSKTYSTRIDCEDGSYIDLAACGMPQNEGIVVVYYHTSKEYVYNYNLSFEHVLTGYDDKEDGNIVVASGNKIIASNNKAMVSEKVDNYAILNNIKDKNVSNKLIVAKSDSSSSGYNFGVMVRGRDYYVYIYMPERNVFRTAPRHILYTVAIYIMVALAFNAIRARTAQAYEMEQHRIQRQYALELEEKNKQLEESIRREEKANAAKSDFLSRMTHDIRTPLNGIIGLLKIDEKHMEDTELINANRKKMSVAANHLLSLINDILQMSKLEDGNIELSNEVVDLRQLVKDVITIVEQRASEAGVNLKYDRMPDNDESYQYKYVYASPLHLRQIFLNIYGNCIKYNNVGGVVETHFRCIGVEDDVVTYQWIIHDTGIGMSEEFLSHIFEPFVQEKSDARSVYQGTGLGMSIVKTLVDKMDGTIDVASKKGAGSEFTIRIPFKIADITPDIEEEKEEKENATTDIRGVRLLLAEDNKLNAEIVETILKDEGAEVKVACDGQQVVNEFANSAEGSYDAILMDVMMPNLDGISAAKRIRAMDRKDAVTIPIIAMTANAFEEDAKECINAGMNAHMAKPLDMDVLIDMIAGYCNK